MKKINFYIGSNNQTHLLEKEKAIQILQSYYEGMSISELVGVWKGEEEKTILVSVVCEAVDYTQVKTVCKKLNAGLEQQAIMVEILDSNTLFISER